MSQSASSIARGVQAEALRKSFVEGVDWPIDAASLAALLDMGLDAQQIAHYFSVTPGEVIQLIDALGARRCYIPVS